MKKMLTSSKFRFFVKFSDVVGSHSQVKSHVSYIYSERTFNRLSYPFYKTQKTDFSFGEIDLSAILQLSNT